MATLNGAEGGLRLAAAVGLEELWACQLRPTLITQLILREFGEVTHSLTKNLRATRVLDRLPDLCLTRIRPHNLILPRHLRLQLLPELRIDGLISLNRVLEPPIHAADLRHVLWIAGARVLLEFLYPRREAAVQGHGFGGQAVKLAVSLRALRGIGVVERLLLQVLQALEVAPDTVDAATHFTAFVQNRERVAAGLLGGVGAGVAVDVAEFDVVGFTWREH